MALKMPHTNLLSRLRHRRGFGIHSPYAYKIVRNVIAPQKEYAYYAEARIKRMSANSPHPLFSIACATMRWIALHPCKDIYLSPSLPDYFKVAAKKAYSPIDVSHILTSNTLPSVIILLHKDTPIAKTRDILKKNSNSVIFCIGYRAQDLWDSIACKSTGIFFHAPEACMFVPYQKTAFTHYDIAW